MKEFEGYKLEEKEPFRNCALIFWAGDELSQCLMFDSLQDRQRVLDEIIEGKGILVRYDFDSKETRVFPWRVLLIDYTKEFEISMDDFRKIRKEKEGAFTNEVLFPPDRSTNDRYNIGFNKHQPRLAQ